MSLTSAWAAMMTGELDGMERWLDAAESALTAGDRDTALTATSADTEDLRAAPAMVWLYRAALAQARGDVPAIARNARKVLEVSGSGDRFVRAGATGYLGFAAWLSGEVDEALATFTEAVSLLHAAGDRDAVSTRVLSNNPSHSCGSCADVHRCRRLDRAEE